MGDCEKLPACATEAPSGVPGMDTSMLGLSGPRRAGSSSLRSCRRGGGVSGVCTASWVEAAGDIRGVGELAWGRAWCLVSLFMLCAYPWRGRRQKRNTTKASMARKATVEEAPMAILILVGIPLCRCSKDWLEFEASEVSSADDAARVEVIMVDTEVEKLLTGGVGIVGRPVLVGSSGPLGSVIRNGLWHGILSGSSVIVMAWQEYPTGGGPGS